MTKNAIVTDARDGLALAGFAVVTVMAAKGLYDLTSDATKAFKENRKAKKEAK